MPVCSCHGEPLKSRGECRVRAREADRRYRQTDQGRERNAIANRHYNDTVKGLRRKLRYSLSQKLTRLEESHP